MKLTTNNEKGFIARFKERAEFDRFALISGSFLLIGSIGGITVGIFAYEHIWQIGIIAAATMLSLSLMLAMAPMKYVLWSVLIAIAIDLVFILVNLF